MSIIRKILNKMIILIQLPLVLLFIIFEEVIWEGIARPIYVKIKSLKILKKFERVLENTHRGVILSLFIVIFTIVETAGIMAGVLFIKGQILFGLGLYLTKIPIAGFTFWLFKVTKSKLLSFGWFEWIYNKMMIFFSWLKGKDIYIDTIIIVKSIKEYLKYIKAKYFAGGEFGRRMKKLYVDMKKIFDRR